MYQPKFTITPSINQHIATIERTRAIVERSSIVPSQEIILRRRSLIEATRSSTGIEGNPLDKEQVEHIFQGKRVSAHERFISEVKNYKDALTFMRKDTAEKQLFRVSDILHLHRLTMKNLLERSKIGTWRTAPVYVVNITPKGEDVQYEGPAANAVPSLIDDLFVWIKKEGKGLHPILAAGILHYEFVSIHPFADGNGRVARLLTMWYLYGTGYGLRDIVVPETYYFSNRQAYYLALNQAKMYQAQRNADQTPWLEYFTQGLAMVTQEVQKKITRVSALPMSQSDRTLTLSEEDFRIVDFALSLGKIAIQDVVDMLEIPKRTVQRRLKRLADAGILLPRRKGPASHYVMKK